ncbi:conserved hypothetical protein [Neospora caninum Liverpool]|uniref:Uncharacterized protein n=1 Tax=Neospora caninum (strain Liverpool) TaxID=572307 RepID=F0VM90_NEOCL|nr:conserved hypothetical protein [Neospora caninum Liverpool]CBZ54368.1 conserved hypothetical protein [Neospora caninum Liverpool]CEL69074.1 TPA: hypothetical protein BN1204_047980 [Neospora caninum Liverpool]|eukprot:XP_003884398.1 conserved hypothetical protein [Neospora caninum Liverpool]
MKAKTQERRTGASRSPSAEDKGKVLSENIRRLRFMQGKNASGQNASGTQGAPSQRLFHQHQLRLLQQQQKQLYQLQKSQESGNKDKREGASPAAEPRTDPNAPASDSASSAASSSASSAAVARQREEEKRRQIEQVNELRKHWYAPGWECAEDIYELQQEEDMEMQLHIGHPSVEAKRQAAALVVSRRAYGGVNPFVEANMRRIEKKALHLERRQEEEKEAKRWQAVHCGRQNIPL